MDKKDLIEKEIEKTLRITDEIKSVKANSFLFSKIINKIAENKPIVKSFNFKIAISIVVVCIITNFAVLFNYNKQNNILNLKNTDSTRMAQIKSLASEYSLTNYFYFY